MVKVLKVTLQGNINLPAKLENIYLPSLYWKVVLCICSLEPPHISYLAIIPSYQSSISTVIKKATSKQTKLLLPFKHIFSPT